VNQSFHLIFSNIKLNEVIKKYFRKLKRSRIKIKYLFKKKIVSKNLYLVALKNYFEIFNYKNLILNSKIQFKGKRKLKSNKILSKVYNFINLLFLSKNNLFFSNKERINDIFEQNFEFFLNDFYKKFNFNQVKKPFLNFNLKRKNKLNVLFLDIKDKTILYANNRKSCLKLKYDCNNNVDFNVLKQFLQNLISLKKLNKYAVKPIIKRKIDAYPVATKNVELTVNSSKILHIDSFESKNNNRLNKIL
jgi:hypothetical protein